MAGWTLHTPSQHNQPCLLSKLFPVFIEKYFLFVRGSISCLYTGYFLVITRRIFFFRNKCLAGWTLHLNKSFPINTENNQRSISPFVKSQEREVVLALKCHLKSTKGQWRSFWWNWNRFRIKIPFFYWKKASDSNSSLQNESHLNLLWCSLRFNLLGSCCNKCSPFVANF